MSFDLAQDKAKKYMADNYLANLDTREKANLADALGAAQNATATFANTSGDTFTGIVNFTTLTSTGAASLANANIPTLTATNIATSGTASIITANLPTVTGAVAGTAALTVRKTTPGNMSIGTLRISGSSAASQAVLEFYEKGFVSITSTVLTTVANTDYAIRVQVGDQTRWIPLYKDAAIIGAAAF